MAKLRELTPIIIENFQAYVERFQRGINNPELTYDNVASAYCRMRKLPDDTDIEQPSENAANIILMLLAAQEVFDLNSNNPKLLREEELHNEVERLRSELLIAKTEATVFIAKCNQALAKHGIKEI